MKYMLDTDIASYFSKGSHPDVDRRMAAVNRSDVCISAITRSELLYGVEISSWWERDAARVAKFLAYANVLDYPSTAAEDYVSIRAELKQTGRPIGPNDLFLAAHARHLGLTLVTNNTREFSRVPGLKLENWAEAS
jgi:tRNA(fMet)-specific endonuclease VapC